MATVYIPCTGECGPDGRCVRCGHVFGAGSTVGAAHYIEQEVTIFEQQEPQVVVGPAFVIINEPNR